MDLTSAPSPRSFASPPSNAGRGHVGGEQDYPTRYGFCLSCGEEAQRPIPCVTTGVRWQITTLVSAHSIDRGGGSWRTRVAMERRGRRGLPDACVGGRTHHPFFSINYPIRFNYRKLAFSDRMNSCSALHHTRSESACAAQRSTRSIIKCISTECKCRAKRASSSEQCPFPLATGRT